LSPDGVSVSSSLELRPTATATTPPTPAATTTMSGESPTARLIANTATGVHVAGPARPHEHDPYFKSSDGALKTYSFDYEALTKFDIDMYFANAIVGVMVFPLAWPALICTVPIYCCFQKQNVRDQSYAQHLAITQDGIRFVVDRHKTSCRLDCQDVGKASKTVPYDKMTDCDIEEPAGSAGPWCWLVPRVLSTVHVDTASSGAKDENGATTHELTIRGLIDPEGFKKDVWAMKRGEAVDGVNGTVAPMAVSMIRDASRIGGAPAMDTTTQPLLTEQNALLREMLATMNARAPAAASEELRSVAAALQETNELLRKLVVEKEQHQHQQQ